MNATKEKILIIDDSPEILLLLGRFLKASGYEIREAHNGQNGLKLIGEFMPDLILLDIIMPDIDGFKVCEKLKSDPDFMDIPVIFLSARSDTADKVKGLAIGGADYITKPFDRGEVMARIENQLKIRRLTDALMAANLELMQKQKNLDEDLQAAAGIQQGLLPQKLPEIQQLNIAWKFMPSEKIGGDIFNVIRLDEDHVAFYMVDISGHGVPAALVTFSVSQALQPHHMGYTVRHLSNLSCGHEVVPPAEVLKALDAEYPWERFEKFFTIIYIIIDLSRENLIYSNAGHPPPMVLHRDGSYDLLEKRVTVIGLDGIVPFEEEGRKLHEGDKILCYTDGVFEITNEKEEIFGEKRFHKLAQSLVHLPVHEMLEQILTAIQEFAGEMTVRDDVSLLGIGYKDQIKN
jgi:sigma-B regulation protein RsbU (phosphoserine phosphatase)